MGKLLPICGTCDTCNKPIPIGELHYYFAADKKMYYICNNCLKEK